MKLRNKKTGMIGEAGYISTSDGTIIVNNINDQDEWYDYKSLAELNAEWEDVSEEPKEYWCIDWTGGVNHIIPLDNSYDKYENNKKEIGNYFETKEDAEKAVEKLKAWKRLKDKEVKLKIVTIGHKKYLEPTAEDDKTFDEVKELIKDFELIFGGEE